MQEGQTTHEASCECDFCKAGFTADSGEGTMLRDTPSKDRGTPRHKSTYRGWKRNNRISWKGVETDRIKQHPPLIKQVSKRGEVSYKEA